MLVFFEDEAHAALWSFGELDLIHEGVNQMNSEPAWADIIEVATFEFSDLDLGGEIVDLNA